MSPLDDPEARRRPGGAWRSLLPLALLLAQILVVHQQLVAHGDVRPIRVPDTDSYINQSQMSTVDGALMHYRSLGYPTLMRIFGWRELPGRELWLFFAAVVVFYWGVRSYAGSAWVGLAAASPLLYGHTLELLGRIQPDFVSSSLVLVAVAGLLLLLRRPRHPLYWSMMVLAVFAAYQMRPATLFVVAWLPAAGWALAALERRRADRVAPLRFAALVALATIGPFLAFASWRWSRVGEFGLVSFGGYNMSGLAASLVDEAMLEELDGANRRMARQMYNMRSRRGLRPYRPGEGSEEWFSQYSFNIFRVGTQTGRQQIVLDEGSLHSHREPHRSQHVKINAYLRQVSREIIKRRFPHYLSWVKDANLRGWRQLADSPWVAWPAALCALSLGLTWLGRRGALGARERWVWPPRSALGLLLLGVSFFFAYVFLISLLSFPFPRYYYGTVVLLPSALCAVLAAHWQRVAAPRRVGPRE